MRASRRDYLQQSVIATGMAATRGPSTSTPSYKVTYPNSLKVSVTYSNFPKVNDW